MSTPIEIVAGGGLVTVASVRDRVAIIVSDGDVMAPMVTLTRDQVVKLVSALVLAAGDASAYVPAQEPSSATLSH